MQQPADAAIESLTPLDTRVRFSLRGIFIAVAAIGAWLAAVAPWFREWNWDQRGAFLMIWCSMALGAISMAAIFYSRRVRAQRRAGAVHFRLPMPINRYALFFGVAAGLFAFGISTVLAFTQAIYPEMRAHGGAWIWNLLACQNGGSLAMAGLGVWWKTTRLELCDEGVLGGFGIQPWSNVRGFRWGGSDPDQLVLQWRRWGVVTVRVNASDKPAVEQFLKTRLAANSRLQS